jgi:hypothetical protein
MSVVGMKQGRQDGVCRRKTVVSRAEQSVKGLRKAEGAAQPGEVNPVLVAAHV